MDKKVLVLDDDTVSLNLVVSILEMSITQKIEISSDGFSGLQKLMSGKFDLIITDQSMPRMDGMTVVEVARSLGVQTPVIVITKFIESELIEKAYANSVFDIIQKPINQLTMVGSVKSALLNPNKPILSREKVIALLNREIEKKNNVLFDFQELKQALGLKHEDYLEIKKLFAAQTTFFLENLSNLYDKYNPEELSKLLHMYIGASANVRAQKLAVVLQNIKNTVDAESNLTVSDLSVLQNIIDATLNEMDLKLSKELNKE